MARVRPVKGCFHLHAAIEKRKDGIMISLKLEADGVSADIFAGWEFESFSLSTAARGDDKKTRSLDLPPDTVLELELSDGTRLLVAADDAERYLGDANKRGDGKPGEIVVGPALRLSGSHLPAGPSREGLGAWVLKSLKVYKKGPAGMTALAAAGSFQDSRLEHRTGLFRCDTDQWALSPIDTFPATAEPVLLLLHGMASSAEGSFKGLWQDKYLQRLVTAYGDQIYAFEHRSLTESPIANALDLVKTLPEGAILHIVSHSLSGMVGELLSRSNVLSRDSRPDSESFSEGEIRRFLEHAERTGRKGFEADADRLRELGRELKSRAIRVERFVRVACPARGTTLVSGRLDRWASVMLNLLGKGLDTAGKTVPCLMPVTRDYDLFQNFLLAVVKERCDARVLPGLEAVMPDSPLVALLNTPGIEVEHPLYILAGDYQGEGILSWLGDCLSEAFYGGQSDLVVNTPSMSGGAARRKGIWQKFLTGPQVNHLSYFRRDESVLPLFAALEGNDRPFTQLTGPSQNFISRGGLKTDPRLDAPIAFLLPGIMGSHIQIGSNRIWFDPTSLIAGDMALIGVGAADVSPDGWMDITYASLSRHLSKTHEVRPFAYDWRLSIQESAAGFGRKLDKAMQDAEKRGQPLHIVAHSMGGLVARLAMKGRWNRFKSLPGSRLLQLGTPNRGSHSIAAVLLGRDDFVQMIERWFDWKHDMREFLGIVRDFPGLLELLPWPEADGRAADGVDYFDPLTWQDWFCRDPEAGKGKGWQPPQAGALNAARNAVKALAATELDTEATLYVAGSGETPVAIRLENGRIEIGWTCDGDGRVPWKTGIPPGVRTWYAKAAHGDLPKLESAFKAYVEILETGRTRLLSEAPSSARGAAAPLFRPRTLIAHTLYPSEEEVLSAAMGGARSGRAQSAKVSPAIIEVFHGSLAQAESPVLIGAYANDSLRGSALFLNRHLKGRMERAFMLGCYPGQPEDAAVFFHPAPGEKPGGAIVVGLGAIGDLLPGTLTRSLTHGLLEYARVRDQDTDLEKPIEEEIRVSALLVGTGHMGLSTEVGARCLLEALRRANRQLAKTGMTPRIGRITVFEEQLDLSIRAVEAFRDIVRESRFLESIAFDGLLHSTEGGFLGRQTTGAGRSDWHRMHITSGADKILRFTLVTDRARNEVCEEPDQRQAVDGLIRSATCTTADHPGLSRTLFELMVPNEFKDAVSDLRGLMLAVDTRAAAYPWELMRETGISGEPPLAVRIGLVRQLASPHGRGRMPVVRNNRVFILGDTGSGLAPLPGAIEEAREIARIFKNAGYEVKDLYQASAQLVFESLFDGHYRSIHLAGHGIVSEEDTGYTGMVLGPGTYLTAAQIRKLRRVPEFVFINCCHLGSMGPDTRPRWGKLASNLATEFIEMGCRAVIAAGWAVDDQAASTFARIFYNAMLKGERFGEAVRLARAETFNRQPSVNTWGAFQAYGDERYQFVTLQPEWQAPDYVHIRHLWLDLDMFIARLKGATEEERISRERELENIEACAQARYLGQAVIRERLGTAWAELGWMNRAIGHFRAALVQEDAGFSLHALERLACLEIRHGAEMMASGEKKMRAEGNRLMLAGFDRIAALLNIGRTVKRLSLLASYWKHRAEGLRSGRKNKEVTNALFWMEKSYWDATDASLHRNGARDYDFLINALDGAFLCAARGETCSFDEHRDLLGRFIDAVIVDGRRRYAEKREFSHALAEVEAERIHALWACLENRPEACITQAAIQDKLAARYCDILVRLHFVQKQDQATRQIEFLITMLPADNTGRPIKRALRQLIGKIKNMLPNE